MTEEEAFVRAFVAPHQRQRYLAVLKTAHGRRTLINDLNHRIEPDRRYSRKLSSDEDHTDLIEAELRKLGASSDCYVISGFPEIDAQTVQLRLALETVHAYGIGSLISCIAGRLGYLEAETRGFRWICYRAPPRRKATR